MGDLKRSDFHTAVNTNINQYAKDTVKWHSGNPRDSEHMDSAPLVALSYFDRDTSVSAGVADASALVAVIKAEAERCSSIRKVYTGKKKYFTQMRLVWAGLNLKIVSTRGTTTITGKEWGIAALNSNYRQAITALDSATGWPYYVGTDRNADLSNMNDLIAKVKDELYEVMHNGPSIDLTSCHTDCHNNCHTSRSRR